MAIKDDETGEEGGADTGAANGIGARGLSAGRRTFPNRATRTVHMIEELGGRALAVRCDVRCRRREAALDKTVEAGRLDFAFNNAGVEPKNPLRPQSTRKRSGIGFLISTCAAFSLHEV
ncbi:MAG: hypothetical protein WKF37_12395 [Bryobacteraceae bacterium]